MERTKTQPMCVCVCVCVHLSVEGIACTFFKTIVSLHKPPTFGGETNHFSVFFFFFRKWNIIAVK
jgi:hypothetical protein